MNTKMYDQLLIVLTILAVLFLILSKIMQGHEEPFWSPVLAFMAMFLFFILAFGVMNIEKPYSMFNATSGNIETGTNIFYGDWELIYMYAGLGFASAIIMVFYIMIAFKHLAEQSGRVKLRKHYHK